MALPKLIQTNDANFESDVLRTPHPAGVFLLSSWNGACKLMSPLVAEMAEAHGPDLKVAMLDIDDNPVIPATYRVRTLPTFLFFSNGDLVNRIDGACDRETLERAFEQLLL